MPEIEVSRTLREGNVTKGGFIVDLASTAPFDPDLFDQEIKIVGAHMLLPGTSGEKVHAKFIVVGDKLFVFSAQEQHLDGFWLMLRVFEDKDINGETQSAGMINVDFRKGSFGTNLKPQREIYGSSFGYADSGELTREQSEKYKQTILKEKLGEHFKISGELPEGFGKNAEKIV